jgi:hypothetical protein
MVATGMLDLPALFPNFDEIDVVTLTLLGEARGLPIRQRIHVGLVIHQRVALGTRDSGKRFGLGWKAVCWRPMQFSCWQPSGGAQNHAYLMSEAQRLGSGKPVMQQTLWHECKAIAHGLVGGYYRGDCVGLADHYLTSALWGTSPPAWARGVTPAFDDGAHVFLRLVN